MSWFRRLPLVLGALLALTAPGSAQQDAPPARIALVIGNSAYPQARIAEAVTDSRAVAATLRGGAFDVVTAEDVNRAELQQAIATFAGKLKRGAHAVVFYSGHAVQLRNRNFLVPVGAQDVAQDAVDLDQLIDPLIVARPASAVVVLDASRDNPWQAKLSRSSKGLLAHERMETIAVVFTAAPGQTVPDGVARPNPAVQEWLQAIRTPGLDMTTALARTRDAVARLTRRNQQLWISSEPPKGLIVTPVARPAAIAETSRAVIPPPAPDTSPSRTDERTDAYELAFWETIRTSKSAAEYRAYLDAYPNGRFAALARTREQLYGGKPAAPAAPPAATAAIATPKPTPTPPRPATAAPSPATMRDCDSCPELTLVPPGSFQMGSNDLYEFEKPTHQVTVRGFYLGTREVTFEEWDACVDQGGCSLRPDDRGLGRGKRPVTDIHWNDANAYLAWLSLKTGRRYRLPTESEWEYAARAGSTATYPWGQALEKERANCIGCNDQPHRQTIATGQFPPNGFGLLDMAGNAAEWVADCWSENYRAAPRDGSAYTAPGCRERVLRGGSFNNDPRYLRSAARFKYEADVRYYTNGLRVAREQ
jgi:formylglycine-generating enzyme required for sulfatase activity